MDSFQNNYIDFIILKWTLSMKFKVSAVRNSEIKNNGVVSFEMSEIILITV